MKRFFALALVLAMLLAALSACAEESAGTLRFSRLSVSHAEEGGNKRTVKLSNFSLLFAVGSPAGTPTIQATLDNGRGQVLDAVIKIEGSEILVSMGGISGVFTVDLKEFTADEAQAAMFAQLLGGSVTLAANHLGMVLRSLTNEGQGGSRSLEGRVPAKLMAAAMKGMLDLCEGMEATADLDMDQLRRRVASMKDDAKLNFRYNEGNRSFTLTLTQGNETAQLSGRMELGSEQTFFIDISHEEERYDLVHMDASELGRLKEEANMIAIKFLHFADGSGLDDIM